MSLFISFIVASSNITSRCLILSVISTVLFVCHIFLLDEIVTCVQLKSSRDQVELFKFRAQCRAKYTRCLKDAALKLLYGVQKNFVGEGKIFKKFLVFISLHSGSFCKDI
jgi:uncharacterized membrane protein YhiD involved in acid resistance